MRLPHEWWTFWRAIIQFMHQVLIAQTATCGMCAPGSKPWPHINSADFGAGDNPRPRCLEASMNRFRCAGTKVGDCKQTLHLPLCNTNERSMECCVGRTKWAVLCGRRVSHSARPQMRHLIGCKWTRWARSMGSKWRR